MKDTDKKRFAELWQSITDSTAPHRDAKEDESSKRVMRTYFAGLAAWDYPTVEDAAIAIVQSDAREFFPSLSVWIERCRSIARRDPANNPEPSDAIEPDSQRRERIRAARQAFCDAFIRLRPSKFAREEAQRLASHPILVRRNEPCARCDGTGIVVRPGRTERGNQADRVAHRCECSA